MYGHVYPIGPDFHPAPVEKRSLPDAKRQVDAAGIAHKMALLPVR